MDKPAALAAIGALVYGYATVTTLLGLREAVPEAGGVLGAIRSRCGRRGDRHSATADEADELTRLVNERFAK